MEKETLWTRLTEIKLWHHTEESLKEYSRNR